MGVSVGVSQDVGLSRKFQLQSQMPSDQVSELTKLLGDLDPADLAKVMDSVMGEQGEDDVVDVKALVQGLLNLSPDQISALPESTQRQVLRLLEKSMAV